MINKKGQDFSIGALMKTIFFVIVLVVVVIGIAFLFSGQKNFFDFIGFGKKAHADNGEGLEKVRYLLSTAEVQYFDGNEWQDFGGQKIKLGKKEVESGKVRQNFFSYLNDAVGVKFNYLGIVYEVVDSDRQEFMVETIDQDPTIFSYLDSSEVFSLTLKDVEEIVGEFGDEGNFDADDVNDFQIKVNFESNGIRELDASSELYKRLSWIDGEYLENELILGSVNSYKIGECVVFEDGDPLGGECDYSIGGDTLIDGDKELTFKGEPTEIFFKIEDGIPKEISVKKGQQPVREPKDAINSYYRNLREVALGKIFERPARIDFEGEGEKEFCPELFNGGDGWYLSADLTKPSAECGG